MTSSSLSTKTTVTTGLTSTKKHELDTILQSPDFSVAWYLNTALAPDNNNSNEEEEKDEEDHDNNNENENKNEKERMTTTKTKKKDISMMLNKNETTTTIELQQQQQMEQQQQTKMTELALQLQIQTQICHEEISKISIELQTILPRCMNDMNRISMNLNGLQSDSQLLVQNVTNRTTTTSTTTSTTTNNATTNVVNPNMGSENVVDTTTTGTAVEGTTASTTSSSFTSSMETLSTLHALQANLIRTKEILTAAATWDTTVQSIAPLLVVAGTGEGGGSIQNQNNNNNTNLIQAVQFLLQLEHGERALRGMPNRIERYDSIKKIRYQILSLLQPQLKQALVALLVMNQQSHDPDEPTSTSTTTTTSVVSSFKPLQQCVQLYGQLNQLPVLQNEYIKNRPMGYGIHKLWFEYKPNVVSSSVSSSNTTTESSTSFTFPDWLVQIWFDTVITFVSDERRQCTMIFQNQQQNQNQQQPDSSSTNTTMSYVAIVPEMMIRIFAECFRPILPSFQSRLENSYPSTVTGITTTGGASSSSFTTVGTIYERTLQFFSIIYEIIVNHYMDMIESGTIVPLIKPAVTTMTSDNTSGNNNDDDDEDDDDFNSSTTLTTVTSAPMVYKELTNVFIQVFQPFVSYQKNFPSIENKYLKEEMKVLTQQIESVTQSLLMTQGGGGGGNTNDVWDQLQNGTMDQLLDLTNQIIPIVEGSIGRYELFNGGYNVTLSLQVLDRIISNYISDIAYTIQKLSTTITTTTSKDNYTSSSSSSGSSKNHLDDAHVLCALNVLKIAATNQRNLHSFEQYTRERFQLLVNRILDAMNNERRLQESLHYLYPKMISNNETQQSGMVNKMTFELPETMSVIEIDSLLTRAVFHDDKVRNTGDADDTSGDDDTTQVSLTTLQRLVTSSTADDNNNEYATLYPDAWETSKQLTLSCHTFVFEICYAVPRHYLTNMSSMPAWKEKASFGESWGVTSSTAASYGTLPQPYVTHIGEHMLALVQALEPFANDPTTLELANVVMDQETIREVAYQPWVDFILAASGDTSGTDSELIKSFMIGTDLVEYVIGVVPMEDEPNHDDDDEDDEHTKASTAFCNKWLDVVSSVVTARILECIMRIPMLTPKGCEHLHADLGYIVNVLSALGISGHPHPLLGHVAEICILDKDVTTQRVQQFDRTNPVADFVRAIEERISAMRG